MSDADSNDDVYNHTTVTKSSINADVNADT